MTGINPASLVTSIQIDQQPDSQKLAIGEIVKGFILDKSSEGTKVMIEGRETLVLLSALVVEPIGDEAEFEVVKSNSAKLTLRYRRPDEAVGPVSDAGIRMKSTKVANGYQQMIDQSIRHFDAEDTLKMHSMVKGAQSAIESIVNTMTEPDIMQMMQDGMKPEKVSVELIAQVLKHNKPLVKAHQIEVIEVHVTEELGKLRTMYEDEERLSAVATALKKADMPIKKRYVDQLLCALRTVDEIKAMTQEEAMKLVQSEKTAKKVPTIDQIYKAIHSPMPEAKSIDIKDSDLEKMVIDHMRKESIPVTNESVVAAKLMVQRGVSITANRLAFILAPEVTMDEVQPLAMLDAMVEKLEANQRATKVQMVELKLVSDEIENSPLQSEMGSRVSNNRREALSVTIDLVSKMTNVQMAKAVLTNRHNTLAQAAEVVGEDQQSSESGEALGDEIVVADELEKALHFKRQLSEIRLKMTLEVAVRLEKQGLKVDTAPIEEVVRALEVEEIDLRRIQLLAYSDTSSKTVDLEAIDHMKQTMHHVKALAMLQEEASSIMMKKTGTHTLSHLAELATNLDTQETEAAIREAINTALNKYDVSMTEIRPDLGDRIERTFSQIDPMLKALDIPVTQANINAVEILAKNEMPVTEATILEIQIAQEKVDLVTEKMTPVVVVKMIQSGINPAVLKIDELLAFITAYEEENALTETVKISELIHNLDQGDVLTNEERRSLMAIYRTMDTVVRSKGAATGFMVKRSMPLTLEGLFEAAKYIRKTRQTAPSMQVNVDDAFGVLEKVSNKEATIREQVSPPINEDRSMTPVNILGKQLMDLRVMSFIRAMARDGGHNAVMEGHIQRLDALPLEEMTEFINQSIKDDIRGVSSVFQEIQEETYMTFVKGNPEILRSMLQHNIPLTFENFSKAVAMEDETFILMKELEAMIKGIENSGLREKAVQHLTEAGEKVLEGKVSYDQFKAALEEVDAMIRETLKPEAPEVYRSSQAAKATVSHTQMIQVTEDYYQIPVYIEDQLSQLNLYILNKETKRSEDNGDLQVLMSFSAGSLGKVQALMSINGNQAEIQLQSTDPNDMPLLRKFESDFARVIAETNYTLSGIRYETFDVPEPVEVRQKPVPSNKKFSAADGHIDWSV